MDGIYEKLLLSRDLASRAELLAMPAHGESMEEVLLAFEELFSVHGAPLVTKLDNGSGFIAKATRELCARHGVLILYSPPRTPSYNGAREAAGGSLKNRARRIAAREGRVASWSSDDVERARRQMNACTRPWGAAGPSPDEAWQRRTPITAAERADFLATYRDHEAEVRALEGIPSDTLLKRADQATIDRAAISRALRTHGLLEARSAEVRQRVPREDQSRLRWIDMLDPFRLE